MIIITIITFNNQWHKYLQNNQLLPDSDFHEPSLISQFWKFKVKSIVIQNNAFSEKRFMI